MAYNPKFNKPNSIEASHSKWTHETKCIYCGKPAMYRVGKGRQECGYCFDHRKEAREHQARNMVATNGRYEARHPEALVEEHMNRKHKRSYYKQPWR